MSDNYDPAIDVEVEREEHECYGFEIDDEAKTVRVHFDNGPTDGVTAVAFDTLQRAGFAMPEEAARLRGIMDAARACVREWKPTADEKARGAGTGVGMRAAEDALIRVLMG